MSGERTQTFMGIPVMTVPRWKLALLRLRYPRDWFVQRGDRVYLIRGAPPATPDTPPDAPTEGGDET